LKEVYIDTKIVYEPYAPGKDNFSLLGYAYNRAMRDAKDWVLFLDQDVFLINRQWYNIALNAVKAIGHKAGWITAMTNRIGCGAQLVPNMRGVPDDLTLHEKISMDRYRQFGNKIENITSKTTKLSGFFILTHKQAWEDAGGFNEDLRKGFDNDYCNRVRNAGYKLYRLPGLYVYHACWRKYPRISGIDGHKNDEEMKLLMKAKKKGK